MAHLILLGDSIFDNAAYVPGGEPVIEQLRSRLPRTDRATLLARDGSIVATVPKQIAKIPEDSSHLILSVGGNNALEQSSVLRGNHSATDAFIELAAVHQSLPKDIGR